MYTHKPDFYGIYNYIPLLNRIQPLRFRITYLYQLTELKQRETKWFGKEHNDQQDQESKLESYDHEFFTITSKKRVSTTR